MKITSRQLLLLFAFLFLGLSTVLQVRSVTKNSPNVNDETQKYKQYIEALKKEREIGIALRNSVSENISKKEQLILNSTNNNDKSKDLKIKWMDSKFIAGMTDVEGPGIIITLNDSKTIGSNPMNEIIHDSNILRILNDLKIAGAQAMSINDERIISSSEIICTGPTIRVNKTRYAVPFVIKAIGNLENLYSDISKSNMIANMKFFGISVEIEKSKSVLIYKYKGNFDNIVNNLEEAK